MNDQKILEFLAERCVGFATVCGIRYEAASVQGKLRPMVTQSCSIHYLRPVSGPLVLAEGVCLKAGRRVAVVKVDVREEGSGRVCATGVFEQCYLDL